MSAYREWLERKKFKLTPTQFNTHRKILDALDQFLPLLEKFVWENDAASNVVGVNSCLSESEYRTLSDAIRILKRLKVPLSQIHTYEEKTRKNCGFFVR